MVFERPRPRQNPPSQAPQSPNPPRGDQNQPRRVITVGDGNNSGSSGGNGGNGDSSNNQPPSPWLFDTPPSPDPTASFVEYLRWMRSSDSPAKDPTKVQILQMAEQGANYRDRLTQSTDWTKLIAGEGNYFQVKCPWRIRVGGHRGPEAFSYLHLML